MSGRAPHPLIGSKPALGGIHTVIGLVALLPASPANARTTQNVLTADTVQKGLGDLVSNWYTALVLTAGDPTLTVSFYLSIPFRARFKKLEPLFDEQHAAPRRQRLHGINIFSLGPRDHRRGRTKGQRRAAPGRDR